jgi:hypothetical protein
VCTSISESPLLVVLVGILIHRRVCHTPPIDGPQDSESSVTTIVKIGDRALWTSTVGMQENLYYNCS